MSTGTSIEWTDATWNTLSGCTRISEGCLNCYITRTPPFRMAGRKFDSPEIGGKTGIILHEDRLNLPLHWRKPRRVFVNSLADLFHDDVPTEHITKVFDVMEDRDARHHVFQILTKRPARMRAFVKQRMARRREYAEKFDSCPTEAMRNSPAAQWAREWAATPSPNIWLGVSVESQKWANVRIPTLLDTPAAVRFLSCEPLLGPIDLFGDVHEGHDWETEFGNPVCLTCSTEEVPSVAYFRREHRIDGIDWVIVGGESGPRARPMHPDWATSLRDQCVEANVPYFFKQHGEWAPRASLAPEDRADVWNAKRVTYVHPVDGRTQSHGDWGMHDHLEGWAQVQRVGKHAAGRELDGRTWDEMPKTAATAGSGATR